MKTETKRDIITDLSPDDVIFERFEKELPKLLYWTRKNIAKRNVEKAYFPPEPLQVLDNVTLCFEPYSPIGVVKWENIYNGDTWAIAVFMQNHFPFDIRDVHFYYWLTTGSIGFMTEMDFISVGRSYKFVITFSSHTMLRYKDRLKLDVSGFDLITYLVGRTYMNVPRIYERNGRTTFELICADGVFRAPIQDRNILTMKTFISWVELNRGDYKEAKGLWDEYQKAFSVLC